MFHINFIIFINNKKKVLKRAFEFLQLRPVHRPLAFSLHVFISYWCDVTTNNNIGNSFKLHIPYWFVCLSYSKHIFLNLLTYWYTYIDSL